MVADFDAVLKGLFLERFQPASLDRLAVPKDTVRPIELVSWLGTGLGRVQRFGVHSLIVPGEAAVGKRVAGC